MTEATKTEVSKTPFSWAGANGNVVFRTAMIMSHYSQPIDWKPDALEKAEGLWLKFWKSAERCDDPPPREVVRAIDNDMDTPKAILSMMEMAKSGDKKGLYASMRYLGLVPQDGEPVPKPKEKETPK